MSECDKCGEEVWYHGSNRLCREHFTVWQLSEMQEQNKKQATLIEKLYQFLDRSREGFNNDELEGLLIEINNL